MPAAGQTPRLMRQVNGLTPVPVADDIINLQFAYDIYNSTTDALDANQANPLGVGESPNNDSEGEHRRHGAKHDHQRKKVAEHVSGDFRQRAEHGIPQSISVTLF